MTSQQKPGCLSFFAHLFGPTPKAATPAADPIIEPLPYRVRDDFLSPAELSFFHVLHQAVGQTMVICPKVSLGDLFYPTTGPENQTYRNKISRKHIDFLLCEPQSMRPLLGLELDDSSHQQSRRQARDEFIEQVFAAASLPLFRQPVRPAYPVRELAAALKALIDEPLEQLEHPPAPAPDSDPAPAAPAPADRPLEATKGDAPLCPRCRQPMVLRTANKPGPRLGQQFWGCPDYPRCRGVRPAEAVWPA